MLHKLWHIDKDNVTNRVVSFLKTLQYDNIVVAIDSPPYKRKESYPEYKANRDKPDPEQIGCFSNTINKVLSEGFKIAYAEGWEADDVIASIIEDMTDKGTYDPAEVIVYGVDKDLLQVTALCDPMTGEQQTAQSRFGLNPCQIPDYLALIGDKSDNVPHPEGIGDKTAVKLLLEFGSVDEIIKTVETTPEKFGTSKFLEVLKSSKEILETALSLVVLNHNAPVQYKQEEVKPLDINNITIPENCEVKSLGKKVEQQTSVVLHTEPTPYRNSLEPVDFQQAWQAASIFNKSGLYPKFKGPEQMIMIIMRGRELGIGATSSLDVIDMIQGKPTMKAAGMLALVMQHKEVCKFIQCVESSSNKSVWKTHRVGYPYETTSEFTIDDADRMGLTSKDNWRKQPAIMLKWRACSQIIREVYPDIINGLYSVEELE